MVEILIVPLIGHIKFRNETSDPMEFGSHIDDIILEPNSEFHYSLKSDDTYIVDIDLDTTVPTSGNNYFLIRRNLRRISFQHFQLSCSAMEFMP